MAQIATVCWRADRVNKVLNSDAEYVEDDVFLAAHSNHDLCFKDPEDAKRRWWMTPEEMLNHFLSPKVNHVQLAVTGNSGAGKSHLIHWMKLCIPRKEGVRVLSVPRSGTSLRGVLELLVKELPPEQGQKYQEKIDQAGFQNQNREQRKRRLLAEMALAIENDKRRTCTDKETEDWLIGELPNLFRDPYLLKNYAEAKDDVFDALVDHIVDATDTYARVSDRREFHRSDLPLTGVHTQEMAHLTQDLVTTLIGTPDLVPICVDIINRNLDGAVAQTLNFTTDQLITLMNDLRRHLKTQSESLILLIEDFAQLQGIDEALLMALIEKGDSKNGLCDLRWAMAVTTSFYERMPHTVRTRMNYVIDIDPPEDVVDKALTERDILAFAARYLNATRLEPDELRRWYESGERSGIREPVPNACLSCTHRATCHETFGEAADEVGLWPFTQRGLLNMGREKNAISDRFNPRRLIRYVLAEVLDAHRQELVEGRFPSDLLRAKMLAQGKGLPPAVRHSLEQKNGANAARQTVILELWGDPSRIVPIPDGVYQAFRVPAPNFDRPIEIVSSPLPDPSPTPDPRPNSRPQDKTLESIRAWSNNGKLSESAARDLRDLIFEAVTNSINWDQEGLQRSPFAGKSNNALFRPRSIEFLNQETKSTIAATAVRLTIPGPTGPDLTTCSLALEGLYQFHREGSWKFRSGADCLRATRQCLDIWARELVAQFKRYADPSGVWDPAASALDILLCGVVLSGRHPLSDLSTADLLTLCFTSLPTTDVWAQSDSGQSVNPLASSLLKKIRDKHEILISTVKQWACGPKGGQVSTFVDAARLLKSVTSTRRSWKLSTTPPESTSQRGEPYSTIASLHRQLREELPKIAALESNRIRNLATTLEEWVPNGDVKTTLAELDKLRIDILNNGISVRAEILNDFSAAKEEFGRLNLDEARKTAEQAKNGETTIARLANARIQKATFAVNRLIKTAEHLLEAVDSQIKKERDQMCAEGKNEINLITGIRRGLQDLEGYLTDLGDTNA